MNCLLAKKLVYIEVLQAEGNFRWDNKRWSLLSILLTNVKNLTQTSSLFTYICWLYICRVLGGLQFQIKSPRKLIMLPTWHKQLFHREFFCPFGNFVQQIWKRIKPQQNSFMIQECSVILWPNFVITINGKENTRYFQKLISCCLSC